jgi:2-keto-4-pentenoate hydratase/2-oxohepta-3-ene-1,7-dioic acid hydratase in catechol pathway
LKFFMFARGGQPAVGVRVGDGFIDLTAAGLPATLDAILALGRDAIDRAADIVKQGHHIGPFVGLQLLTPLQQPSKAIAVGLNYVDHAAEFKAKTPEYPVLFHRYPTSWVAHEEAMQLPKVSSEFDYEGELVVVIGKAGRYISKDSALDHVFGYSVFNEGTLRNYQFKSQQWMMGKNFDRSGAFGPEIVTADELPSGAKGLQLQTRLNGQVVQNATTSDMIFDVATLISICSEPFALSPGDIIISGTPAGVGFTRKPPLFLRPGDRCEVEIEGIGTLRNTVAAE